MFVSRAKYNKVVHENMQLRLEIISVSLDLDILRNKWNSLVDKLNRKGGQDFIDNAELGKKVFTKEEIEVLISLCHPDKHCGSKKAEEITKKLLSMR